MDLWKLKDSLVYIVSVRIALNNREVLSQNKQAKKKKKKRICPSSLTSEVLAQSGVVIFPSLA